MIFLTLLILSVVQQPDPAKLTQRVAELQTRLADQTQSYNKFVSQGRTSYARDIAKQIKRIKSELEQVKSELEQAQSDLQRQAAIAQSDLQRQAAIAEQESTAKRVNSLRALRLTEEKMLLANGAKKAQTIVIGTSLANYYGTEVALKNTSGGVTYYSFNASANAIEVPKPVIEHSMRYLLVVDNATKKVIGSAFVAIKFDQTVTDTALNAARMKCEKIHKDILGHFDGETAEGIMITIRGGLAEIFKGQTYVTYTDAELFNKAVKKGGEDSGF